MAEGRIRGEDEAGMVDCPAADDIFLPREIINAFVASGAAWRDGPAWRLSKERRLWPVPEIGKGTACALSLGARLSFVIPAWAEKHGATDHTTTSDRQIFGWLAGQDSNGIIVVDENGVVWADLGQIETTMIALPATPRNL